MTCMHCRYFSEELDDAYGKLVHQNTNLPWARQQVNDSFQYMNSPIQLVWNVFPKGTRTFSVKGEDENLSFVNITFTNGKCYVKCTGVCSIDLKGKKKIPRVLEITETPNLCSHMEEIVKDIDNIKGFFPSYFEFGNEINPNQPKEQINNDQELNPPDCSFNVETGLGITQV